MLVPKKTVASRLQRLPTKDVDVLEDVEIVVGGMLYQVTLLELPKRLNFLLPPKLSLTFLDFQLFVN